MMLGIALLILVPAIAIGYGAYSQASTALEKAAQQEALKMTQLNAEMILKKLDSIQNIIQVSSKTSHYIIY